MIKSRHRTFGFWFPTIFSLFFLLLLISAVSQYYYGYTIIKMQIRDGREFFFQAFFGSLGFLLILSILWFNVKNITIDKTNKTISFQNIFTRVTTKYNFSDFDGYIDTFVAHDSMGVKYETVGLVYSKRVLRRIDSYFYSNYKELREALSDCEYLGEVRFGFWNSIRMLLNLEVLE